MQRSSVRQSVRSSVPSIIIIIIIIIKQRLRWRNVKDFEDTLQKRIAKKTIDSSSGVFGGFAAEHLAGRRYRSTTAGARAQ